MQVSLSNWQIDSFIDKMKHILTPDIIEFIVGEYIYKERNLQVIRKQKTFRVRLNRELYDMFNVYYDDNNFKLYKNENNQFVLRNHTKDKQFYMCANNDIVSVPVNNANDLVLFENQQNYDENGQPIQRRIKLYILYI
jgi:hypothetical protein